MNLKTIYLILTGENEVKRPRSKKLLQLIKRSRLETNEYKIIVSGLSSFNLNVTSSESARLARYLEDHCISHSAIIREEESLDTLGNLIFAHRLVKQLLAPIPNSAIIIVLITEGFHIHRCKKLFQRIFQDIAQQYPAVSFKFVAAKPHTRAKYYWQRFRQTLRNTMIDELILDAITADIDLFQLHRYKDFVNYLYSLPVYNTKYKSNQTYNMSHSLYARAIQHQLDDRAAST